MARAVTPLISTDVDRLPDPCRGCLFWELGTPCPQPRTAPVLSGLTVEDRPREPVARKRAWVSARVEDSGPPGAVVEVDGQVAGFALFAPAGSFAARGSLVPSVDRDALLLATVWVRPVHREHGLGRLLIQAAIREAIRRDRSGVQLYADRRWRERACLLPVTWALHEGFEVRREHPRTPLLEIDARRTARWAASLEHAWDEVLAHVPRRRPVPVPRVAPNGRPVPDQVSPPPTDGNVEVSRRGNI
jgi:GNAT superfamily N-acetyltransferase